MFRKKWLLVAGMALFLCLWQNAAFADHDHDGGDEEHGHGQGHGHGKGHEKHDREGDGDHDNGNHRGHYRDHDRELHDWYRGHEDHLPPGLAKRDYLPPDLERQLVVRGTLSVGLQRRMHPCPRDVEQYLPPAPVGYEHTVIGGHIALVNRKTFLVLDVFQF
ncbi:MAG: hypothetical protein JWN74_269 [Acidobacteriaceae bacterium]|nr:hypothetical protein [Acidobacteriaceae bacterium]